MSWSERQRRMLAAMGVRTWAPEETRAVPVAAPATNSRAAEPTLAARADVPAMAPRAEAPLAASRPEAPLPAPRAAVPAAAPATPPPTTPRTPIPLADDRAAHLDWTALQAAVAACTACDLAATRRHTVFGVGHPAAHWMIVGEAPGEKEDEAGEPFVGPAGQLLDQMLRALGLTRGPADEARQVFIANTLKCRPPRNRNPEPEELARCDTFLRRQVALVRPRILLAMGRFAVKQLLGSDEAIGKLRGRVHAYQGVPVVVTYHPAYLLRNLADKARAWDDLCLAAATVDAATPRSSPPPP